MLNLERVVRPNTTAQPSRIQIRTLPESSASWPSLVDSLYLPGALSLILHAATTGSSGKHRKFLGVGFLLSRILGETPILRKHGNCGNDTSTASTGQAGGYHCWRLRRRTLHGR